MLIKLRIPLFAIILFTLAIPNAFPDGKVHVEGQFTFPFSSKKTAKEIKAWSGKCVGIADGDTITVLHNGKGKKIRLYGIDTPEKRQAFGKKAKQFTSTMVYGKTVEVKPKVKDRYGRTVGMVYVDGESLNEALIKNGYAWVYRKYCKESFCKDWLNLESAARYGKIGLWSDPNPVPPWSFRHGKAKTREPAKDVGAFYHGNVKSMIFHKPGCRHYDCKNCTAIFETIDEAIKAGYRPCKICMP